MVGHVLRRAAIDHILVDAEDLLSGSDVGDLVVVSGAPQSGRSTLLRHLADELAEQGWTVVRARVDGGVLRLPARGGLRSAGWVIQGIKISGAAANLALPLAGSIIALAGEIATAAHMRAAEMSAGADRDPYRAMTALADVVERAAAVKPLAIVVDDADQLVPPQVWWDGLFAVTLPRLMEDLPVLAVLSVDGSAAASESHARTVLSNRLLDAEIAGLVELAPLTADDVRRALGDVDETLAGELVRFGRGRPGWIDELLRRWEETGIVVVDDGGWRFGADGLARARSSERNRAEALVQSAVPDEYDRARDVLRLGSLEGPVFTAEAVAAVRGENADTLVAWIGSTLAAADPPLVDRVEDAEGLRRFRIRSALLAGTLRETTLSGSDGPRLAGRYARALLGLYRNRPRFPAAWTISRLTAHAKDESISDDLWRRAIELESLAGRAQRAAFIAGQLPGANDDEERLWLTAQLNTLVGDLLRGSWRIDETVLLAGAAERSARSLVVPGASSERVDVLIDALENLGEAKAPSIGLAEAIGHQVEGAELSATGPRHRRTARLYAAAAEAGLEVHTAESRALAAEHATAAVEFARRIPRGSPDATELVHTLAVATHAYAGNGDVAGGVSALAEAADELRRAGFRRLPAFRWMCSNVLAAAVEICFRIGDAPRAVEFGQRRVGVVSNELSRAVALTNLASSLRGDGRSAEAMTVYCRAVRMAQEMRAVRTEAVGLTGLAWFAHEAGSSTTSEFLHIARRIWPDVVAYGVGPNTEGLSTVEAETATLDDAQRQAMVDAYRADGGAALLRETFGVDVADVDAENARQRPAGPDELVEHAAAVAAWCRELLGASGIVPEPSE